MTHPSPSITAPPAERLLLRAEWLLLLSALVTNLGNGIQVIASAFSVASGSNAASAVGWLFIAVALPQTLLSWSGGRLADRVDRRWLCIICDLLSFVAITGLPLAIHLGANANASIYVCNLTLAAISALFLPANNALIKEVVPTARLATFSAQFEAATQVGVLLSAAAGGFAIQWLGTDAVFLFNGVSFLCSAMCLLAMRKRIFSDGKANTSPVQETATQPGVLRALVGYGLLFAIGNVIVTVSNTLLVVLVVKAFRHGPGILGVVDALAGIGVLIAAAWIGRLSTFLPMKYLSPIGYLGCALFIALQPQFGVSALLVFFPLGAFCFGLARISARALLQQAAPVGRVGQVFGSVSAVALIISMVITLAISKLVDATSVRVGYVTLALTVVALTISSILITRASHATMENNP